MDLQIAEKKIDELRSLLNQYGMNIMFWINHLYRMQSMTVYYKN